MYLMNKDTLKTFVQGALGAMTFGMYHQYTTNRIMDMNNKIIDDKMKKQEMEIEELKKQMALMSQRKQWLWFMV